jgi:adenylosuccinate synthase
MSVWVVVGGQFGSEGKGKIAAHITMQEGIDICIRCGGPNSGHSLTLKSGTSVLRQLPTGHLNPGARLLIPAGALINISVLKDEIEALSLNPSRIGIDRNTMVIEQRDIKYESEHSMRERLSSTLSGVGSALSRRVLRGSDVTLAHEAARTNKWLKSLITNVSVEANEAIDAGRKILLEGTQGIGLSLYHSDYYPKATSRDTSPAAFLSEAGLSPLLATHIILVLRTFPIRVAGEQAGPLTNEISWEDIQRESRCPERLGECTSVSRKLRRVGRFDWDQVARAVSLTRPTALAVNGLDYLDYQNRGATGFEDLTPRAASFVAELEDRLRTPVHYLGAGPSLDSLFEHKSPRNSNLQIVRTVRY